jgi:hypothetical protein
MSILAQAAGACQGWKTGGGLVIPKRPTRIRLKEVTLYYTDKTSNEMNERAVEICKRYGVEAELVKLRDDGQMLLEGIEDWKKVNTKVSEITKVLKEK